MSKSNIDRQKTLNSLFSKMSSKNQELIIQLRFQEKVLAKQADREDKNANKERNLAKKSLAKGDRSFAQYHATNSVRATQQAQFLRENAAHISSMIADLRLAEVQTKMAKAMNTAVKEMEKCIQKMDLEKISMMTLKYDQLRNDQKTAQQIIVPNDINVETDASALLEALDNEVAAEILADTPDIPLNAVQAPAQKQSAVPQAS